MGSPVESHSPDWLWRETLAELRGQLLRQTFDAWLLGSRVVVGASAPRFWVVATRNEYASEWLTHRLYPVVWRTATAVAGRPVAPCFIPAFVARRNRQSSIVNRQLSTACVSAVGGDERQIIQQIKENVP
jgi:chromosomal replication initiation ATPase DnaA